MSKFIFVCRRNGLDDVSQIEAICNNIRPDNLSPNPPHISSDGQGVTLGIFNPNEANMVKNQSVCLGYTDSDTWDELGNPAPNGNFALIRAGDETVEIISDILATRSIWYVHHDDYFVAATSQRMLISYLGNFVPNEHAFSNILASGNLGYATSWDKRISVVPADTTLTLDRKTWQLHTETVVPEFHEQTADYKTHKAALQNAIRENFETLNLDLAHWVLPLSGGYDSRGILMNLLKAQNLRTITWGMETSVNEAGSDAYIAKQLANKFDIPHKYYPTDFSDEPMSLLFERFLKVGEGRSDNIGGYLDGFSIWRTLFDERYLGVIRGDEGFGWTRVKTEKEARMKNGLHKLEDYENLSQVIGDLPEVELPDTLRKRDNENVAAWRDRLYHQFHIPTVLAGLSDLKLSYVELITPLLSKKVISVVRTLPDQLRTDKRLFRDIVDSYGAGVPYAKYGSNMDIESIFKQEHVVTEIKNVLRSSNTLPSQLIEYIVTNMTVARPDAGSENRKAKAVRKLKAILPTAAKDAIKRRMPSKVDVNMLGFRAYMIVKMQEILTDDAQLLSAARSTS